MSNALTAILDYKVNEVAALKQARSEADLMQAAKAAAAPRGFISALEAANAARMNGLICELKRKSPSAGEILPGADPIEIALEYQTGGASCLSILTDGPSFGGSLEDLTAIREAVSLPILRKDFMIDPIQVIEARASGADAILVIMAAVEDALAADLEACAHGLGMDVLVEVHDQTELERALRLSSALIGINNRDLTRMVTDLSVTESLAGALPQGRLLVSESGVKTPADITRLHGSGARCFLIGESLMLSSDRTLAVKSLVNAGWAR
ncbi:MAG: indole-3-glycerol phosphate synthase TrpC [Pseudomonadota bacterium]